MESKPDFVQVETWLRVCVGGVVPNCFEAFRLV